MKKKKEEVDKMRAKDEETIGDPFLTYGFGLIAYKNTLFILFVAFSLFSIIIYPLLETY